MSNEEVNKIIAEYMEYVFDISNSEWNTQEGVPVTEFTDSLDSLVSVWEKIYSEGGLLSPIVSIVQSVVLPLVEGKSIQQAAAKATAKAIQEITK